MKLETLTKHEKMKYTTKEIAKLLRKQFKVEFKNCKFSITMERYSGGSSITVALMSADFEVFKKFEELSDEQVHRLKDGWKSDEEVKQMYDNRIKSGYAQINQYWLKETNVLTDKAKELMIKVKEMVDHYNWDESDSMTDYFEVHFYLHLEVGKWNKSFEVIA